MTNPKLRFILARLREPGSRRALALGLGLIGLPVSDEVLQAISAAGVAVATLVAVLLPETPESR